MVKTTNQSISRGPEDEVFYDDALVYTTMSGPLRWPVANIVQVPPTCYYPHPKMRILLNSAGTPSE
jgi:hypothetical protein